MKPSSQETHPLWHTLSSETVFAHLKSTPAGLAGTEAARRLAAHGPNELQAAHPISPWTILFEQFKNVLIVILLAATALSAFLGHGIEAIAAAECAPLAALPGMAALLYWFNHLVFKATRPRQEDLPANTTFREKNS